MRIFFVDSVVWISAFLKNDVHHQKGKLFLEWFEKQDKIKIFINDYIISEIAAHMRKKAKNQPLLINKIIDMFYEDPRIAIYYTSEENFNLAIEISGDILSEFQTSRYICFRPFQNFRS